MNQTNDANQVLYSLLELTWSQKDLPSPESIPWSEVLALLEKSSLGATLYDITRSVHHLMPPDVVQTLNQVYYWTIVNNALCRKQLKQLDEALSQLEIPAILLKGAALNEELYPSSSPRLIGDIDLLVPYETVPACRKAILDMAYNPYQVEHRPGSLLIHKNQEIFSPPPPFQAYVEMHWHILDVPYYLRNLPMEWFWENTSQFEIYNQTFRVFNPEANLVYLPAHLALHHRLQGLHQVLDLALLIERNQTQINWQKVVQTSQAFELTSALHATLDLLAQCWPTLPIQEPKRLMDGLEPSKMDVRLFSLLSNESRTTTLDFYTTLVSLPDFASWVNYAWVNLFPQPAYMFDRYGFNKRWQLPYWYLYRMLGGLVRFGRMLTNARRIDKESGNT